MNKFQHVLFIAGCGLMVFVSGCEPAKSNRFAAMRNLVIQAKYDQAIGSLQDYVSQSPAEPNASRAGLFLFKAYFAKGNFDAAKKWCDWTIANHPTSLEAQKCEFKIGLILLVRNQSQQAIKHFRKIAASESPLRPEATSMVNYLKTEQNANEKAPVGGVDPQ